MSPEISEALQLLAVGMVSVFVVLTLVVLTGNALIQLVNRFFPLHTDSGTSYRKAAAPEREDDARILAVLTASVEVATQGKGRINTVKKINKPPQ